MTVPPEIARHWFCHKHQYVHVYYKVEYDNFYCAGCREGMGVAFYRENISRSEQFPTAAQDPRPAPARIIKR